MKFIELEVEAGRSFEHVQVIYNSLSYKLQVGCILLSSDCSLLLSSSLKCDLSLLLNC